MKGGWKSHLRLEIDGNCIFADGLRAIWKIFNQTSHMRPEAKLDLWGQWLKKKVSIRGQILFWQSGHLISEVNFGVCPHVGGLIEYLSNSSQTIHKYAIPVNFWPQVAVPAFFHYFTIITVSGLWSLIETFFHKYTIPVNFWPQVAVPALYHYFTIITVSSLWPLIETLFLNLWPRIGI